MKIPHSQKQYEKPRARGSNPAKEEAKTYHSDIVLEVGRKALLLNFSRNWEGLHTVRIL